MVLGELYMWGREEGDGRLGLGPGRGPNEGGGLSVPSKVKALTVPVASVSCGGFFTMALTQEGQLWNWGGKNHSSLASTTVSVIKIIHWNYMSQQTQIMSSDAVITWEVGNQCQYPV